MKQAPHQSNDLAFYIGVNLALLVLIGSVLLMLRPI
jgi:hypothetical protein